jgi:hypothetical protein
MTDAARSWAEATDYLAEPMLGVRAWVSAYASGGPLRLSALITRRHWLPRQVNMAVCAASASHEPSPALDCSCGYYAVDPQRAVARFSRSVTSGFMTVSLVEPVGGHMSGTAVYLGPDDGVVLGLVWLWGRVICGTRGVWRGQYAYPAALVSLSDDVDTRLRSTLRLRPRPSRLLVPEIAVAALGREYGVPVCPLPVVSQATELRLSSTVLVIDGTQVATLTRVVRGLALARMSERLGIGGVA